MSDIVERLRTSWAVAEQINMHNEAADEIKRLRIIAADYQALQHRANAINDENERLRAALQEICDTTPFYDPIVDIARRALEPTPERNTE